MPIFSDTLDSWDDDEDSVFEDLLEELDSSDFTDEVEDYYDYYDEDDV